jgi:hypothetical protein
MSHHRTAVASEHRCRSPSTATAGRARVVHYSNFEPPVRTNTLIRTLKVPT